MMESGNYSAVLAAWVPFSEIDHNLWMGGTPHDVDEGIPEDFDFVVNLYPWGEYDLHPHQVMTQARLYDANVMPDTRVIEALADHVHTCRKHGRVLVHCQQGWNRSGLVTALALMRAGMTAESAIKLIRDKRDQMCLSNRIFHDWLVGYEVAT